VNASAILRNLCIFNITTNNITKSLSELQEIIGCPIPRILYNKITGIANTAKTRFFDENHLGGVTLEVFFRNWRKGSKKMRIFLSGSLKPTVSHNLIKFAETVETVIPVTCATHLNNIWSIRFFSNNVRVFIFKLHNNTLGINTRVSHFIRGISRNCSFCEIARNPEPVDETIFHLFYDCPTAELIRTNFFKWLMEDNNFNLHRHEFFCCCWGIHDNKNANRVMTTILLLFKFFLWENKLRKTLPDLQLLKKFIFRELDIFCKLNKDFSLARNNSGINLNTDRVF
jgi:hypothetical protein